MPLVFRKLQCNPKAHHSKIATMKKFYILLLFFVIGSTPYALAQEYDWVSLSNVLPSALYNDVYAIGNEVWICSGNSAELFYNDAAGTTSFTSYTTPSAFICIHMLNTDVGYAGSETGRVYRTTDGGKNWTLLLPLTGASVNAISFPPTNNDTGYTCGEGGRVYSISASGTTKMNSGVVSNMSSVYFPSDTHGWVCGEDVIRHYTSESGQWNFDQNYPGNFNCRKIFFSNDSIGWIVGGIGDKGAIIHTTNGINWTYQTDPNPSGGVLNAVFFHSDGMHGWAGGNFGKVLKTNDAGENWSTVEIGTTGLINSIFFSTYNLGFLVGGYGEAYRYGEISESDSTNTTLTNIDINNVLIDNFNTVIFNYYVELPAGTTEIPNITATATVSEAIVNITQASALPGMATIVVTAKDGETQQTYTINFTVITDIGDFEQLDKLNIYPNPAKNKFGVQGLKFKDEEVIIEIYDLNSRKLLEQQIPARSENAEIDVSHLKNGVYLCNFISGNNSITQKLIIQK